MITELWKNTEISSVELDEFSQLKNTGVTSI